MSGFGSILIICLVLFAMLLVAYLGVMAVRRWMKAPDAPPAGGFTLEDLRQMRQSGAISQEEYEKLRQNVLLGFADAAKAKNPPHDR